jgi:hypothetical protein
MHLHVAAAMHLFGVDVKPAGVQTSLTIPELRRNLIAKHNEKENAQGAGTSGSGEPAKKRRAPASNQKTNKGETKKAKQATARCPHCRNTVKKQSKHTTFCYQCNHAMCGTHTNMDKSLVISKLFCIGCKPEENVAADDESDEYADDERE